MLPARWLRILRELNPDKKIVSMKRVLFGLLAGCCFLFAGCLQQSYSVSTESVAEMLDSEVLVVTSFEPAWLNEGTEGMWKLTPGDKDKVCAMLRMGENRHVPELVYQTDDEHNPLSRNRFYIYSNNGQCLAATVMNDRVVMHDVVLQPEQDKNLYGILKPYLKHLFLGLE